MIDLKKSESELDILFFRRIKMLLGTLHGPTDLFLSRDDMLAITSLLVGWIKRKNLYIYH